MSDHTEAPAVKEDFSGSGWRSDGPYDDEDHALKMRNASSQESENEFVAGMSGGYEVMSKTVNKVLLILEPSDTQYLMSNSVSITNYTLGICGSTVQTDHRPHNPVIVNLSKTATQNPFTPLFTVKDTGELLLSNLFLNAIQYRRYAPLFRMEDGAKIQIKHSSLIMVIPKKVLD